MGDQAQKNGSAVFHQEYGGKKVSQYLEYNGKCPKISNTKVSDRMSYSNSADPDQTAPEGAV